MDLNYPACESKFYCAIFCLIIYNLSGCAVFFVLSFGNDTIFEKYLLGIKCFDFV